MTNPAKIVDTIGNNYKLLMKIDGELIEKISSRDKDYSEVHPSCLSNINLIFSWC